MFYTWCELSGNATGLVTWLVNRIKRYTVESCGIRHRMRSSKWYYVLIVITLLHVAWSLAGTMLRGSLFDAGVAVQVLYLLGGLLGLLLTPVFFIALYLDAGIVRESSSLWNPNRHLWVGGGILWSLLAFALVRNPAIELIAVAYLLRRFRNPACEGPDDDRHPTGSQP